MEILLLVVFVAGLVWQLSRVAGRLSAVSSPAPTTPLEYRRFNASIETNPRFRSDWAECRVCECPTFDRAGDYPGCQLCGWEGPEGSSEALGRARAAFLEHGTAHPPEELATWGARPLSDQERNHVRSVVALHRRALSGELDFHSWESQMLRHLEELRRTRAPQAG
jgi:hypothetical protein